MLHYGGTRLLPDPTGVGLVFDKPQRARRRRVLSYTSLWERQRPALDISQCQIRIPDIRHLMDRPDSTVAIDGYEKAPLDIVDSPPGSHEELDGRDCPRCNQIAAERDAGALISP